MARPLSTTARQSAPKKASGSKLESLISLYHSNQDAPDLSSEQSLLDYVDAKMLSDVKVSPQDGNQLLRARPSSTDYPEMHGRRSSITDDDTDDFEAYLRKASHSAESMGDDLRYETSKWRPLLETSSAESQRRGRAIIDALHGTMQVTRPDGTIETVHAGQDLVKELYVAERLAEK